MSKTKTRPSFPILPTELEKHLGEVWDPRGHEEQLASANAVLVSFVDDMSTGQLPVQTLKEVQEAAGVLGHYAGYPQEAHETEMFLESSLASSSFKTVAAVLPSFLEEMNDRIKKRGAILTAKERVNHSDPKQRIDDSDVPF